MEVITHIMCYNFHAGESAAEIGTNSQYVR